jgi:hypothetical protein
MLLAKLKSFQRIKQTSNDKMRLAGDLRTAISKAKVKYGIN